jgi:toxin-antitoxin system PIN domain toxin
MILFDVNVLVNAAVTASPHHGPCLQALQDAVASGERIGSNATIRAGMVRICTHARIFQPPMPTAHAFAFLEHLDRLGKTRAAEPGPRHWPLFRDFVSTCRLSGSGVTDAWFAALAIEHDAEWWTCDAGFGTYPGLRWRNLLST